MLMGDARIFFRLLLIRFSGRIIKAIGPRRQHMNADAWLLFDLSLPIGRR